jgi:HSP20 family protein
MARFSAGSLDQPAELSQDVHRLLEDLAKRRPDRRHVVAGECMPVVDVFETETAVEIVLDLPGVDGDAIRVLFKGGVLLVVGEKERPDFARRAPASFHLVERDFGRFARAVRISAAIDGSRIRARLANGELHVVLPRITDRRRAGKMIPVESASTPSTSRE